MSRKKDYSRTPVLSVKNRIKRISIQCDKFQRSLISIKKDIDKINELLNMILPCLKDEISRRDAKNSIKELPIRLKSLGKKKWEIDAEYAQLVNSSLSFEEY